MDFKVYSVVVWALVVVLASADDPKRDKRTVDLVLKSFADVFGYDVVKRISGLPPRQVATPKPTFFPPPVAPLPSGPYSRIILTLGGAQTPVAEQTTAAPVKAAAPVAAVQSAGVIPVLLTQGQVMPMSMAVPMTQTQMVAPQAAPASMQAMAPVGTPMIISSGAAVMTPIQTPNAAQAVMPAIPIPVAPAAPAPAAPAAPAPVAPAPVAAPVAAVSPAAPETPQTAAIVPALQTPVVSIQTGAPAAPQQEANPGVVVNQQGPLRWTLFTAPPRLAETVRRTLNFNLNWDRNVEPLGSPALTAQLQTTAVQQQPSQAPAAPQQQPQPVSAPAVAQQPAVPAIAAPAAAAPVAAAPVAAAPVAAAPAAAAPAAAAPAPAAPAVAAPVAAAPAVTAPQTQAQAQPAPAPSPAQAPAAPDNANAPQAEAKPNEANRNEQANNDQNNSNPNQISSNPNRDEPSQHFKQAISDFWRTSPWNSNNEEQPRDDDRRQSYQEEPEQLTRYEEYDIEPVERIPVARPENNYRLKVSVPLPEENGYYEKEEFVKEETKSPRKVRKNVNHENGGYPTRQKNTRSTKTRRQHRRKNSDDLKTDRSRKIVKTTLYDDGTQNIVQPEYSGVMSKQFHNVYKREKTLPWPLQEAQAESDESEVKNYYKKWRNTRDVYGQQYYTPEYYNTDFSYTIPDTKINYNAPLHSSYSYSKEFPDKARIYSKQSGRKETLVTSNKESKSI